MKTTISKHLNLFLAIAMVSTAACAADTGGDDDDNVNETPEVAYLTIVGDSDVFLENGWTHRLTVRYHDADNRPLAGQVDFRLVGNTHGGNLLDDSGVTNADGVVQVDLVAGSTGDALFTVEATAEAAVAVDWTIAVSEGAPPLPPLDVTGRYSMGSQFDIVSGLPGTAGDMINGLIEMTDDPYDPATYVLDLLVANLDMGIAEDLINAARPALDGIVNDLILSYSPDFVMTILDIGDKLGQITRQFGVISTLDVEVIDSIEGGELSATHVVTGVRFDIDDTIYSFSMADLGEENIVIEGVPFRMEAETKVVVGEHSFPLSYGSMIMMALNEVIIPMVDPTASNLYDVFEGLVDCYSVGVQISNSLGFGSPSLYEGACEIGLAAASSEIENQIRGIDGEGLLLTISGDAKPQDTNTDRKVDLLLNGLWEGTISYAGTPAALARPNNTFRGERMAIP